MKTTAEFAIRPAAPGDWATIRAICCKTGSAGDPIDPSRWPFFGELWVGPYERFLSSWAFVAESEGRVIAYVTGCPDTRALRWRRELCFRPGLLARIAFRQFAWNGDTRRFVRRFFCLDRDPERAYAKATLRLLDQAFPAHLHVNADAEFRGSGVGRALLERYFEALRDRGIRGVHLFCGIKPVPFYEKLGFRELESVEFAPGVRVFALVREL